MSGQSSFPGLKPRGRSGSALGAEAEKFVDELNAICLRLRVAFVARVSSNVKITKKLEGNKVMGVLTGKSVVDAMGWMLDGSKRPIALEIKEIDFEFLKDGRTEAAWRFDLSRLKLHQRWMLQECHAAGGVAALIVIHRWRAYAVPWPVVAAAVDAGQASLSQAEIEPHLCPHNKPYLSRWVHPAAPAVAPAARTP